MFIIQTKSNIPRFSHPLDVIQSLFKYHVAVGIKKVHLGQLPLGSPLRTKDRLNYSLWTWNFKTYQQEGRCAIYKRDIGGTINMWPLPNMGPIYGAPTILNSTYVPGARCAFLRLYFLCGSQSLTCLLSQNSNVHLMVATSHLQLLKERPSVHHLHLGQVSRFLLNSVPLGDWEDFLGEGRLTCYPYTHCRQLFLPWELYN